MAKDTKLEARCIEFLRNYLIDLKEYEVNSKEEDMQYKCNDDRKNDIHSYHTGGDAISADFRVRSKTGKPVYFEVKSTKDEKRLWGRISFNQICAALNAIEYDYYFVIIQESSANKHHFICPDDREKPFMTLAEILGYTAGYYYLGVDIVDNRDKLRKRPKLAKPTLNNNDIWLLPYSNPRPFTVEDMETLQKILSKYDHT